MKKATLQAFSSITTFLTAFYLTITTAYAQDGIVNPTCGLFCGNNGSGPADAQSGKTLTAFIVVMWNTVIAIGALLVLMYFVWGAIDWLVSTGDKGKLEAARNKMMNAFIGLLLLTTSYTLIGFIGELFFNTQFNILSPMIILNN